MSMKYNKVHFLSYIIFISLKILMDIIVVKIEMHNIVKRPK